MPDVDDEVTAGDDFGALESVKTSSELIAPVSGKVIARNDELEDKPELINEDAYEAWIIKVEMSDTAELDALLTAAAYAKIAE
jgi:glycine cleavage system H protein